ncbi:MAG TPA: GntR family transcriptional regulator [Candidatus Solibacter sp.]|nr:GntR family transcriptional regulator [Candidatus Solibacter sp.]
MNALPKTASVSVASLTEQAYYTIRDLILRGKLPLGAALSRRRLAGELGMSLLPISEAIQRLENEGLLESRPQVGTRVRIPTEQDVRDRFIIREALEGQAARLFAERATLQQRQELRLMAEHLDTMFTRLGAGAADPEFAFAVHSYHFQFHMRIAEYSGCAGLREMIQKNNVLVFNWLFDVAGKQLARSPRFHQDFAESLAGTNADAAQAAVRAHVRYGVEETVSAIKLLQPVPDRKWRLGRTGSAEKGKPAPESGR